LWKAHGIDSDKDTKVAAQIEKHAAKKGEIADNYTSLPAKGTTMSPIPEETQPMNPSDLNKMLNEMEREHK
jgi:hypothetical protein